LGKKLNAYNEATLTDEQKKQKQALIDDEKVNNDLKATTDSTYKTAVDAQKKIIEDNDPVGFNSDAQNAAIAAAEKEIERLKTEYQTTSKTIDDKLKEIDTKVAEFEKGAQEQIVANISSNLDKIDVVPNPEQNSITQDDLINFLNNIELFKQKFRVYCCIDSKFLNILKANAMGVKSGGGGRLSHPLPIKYSFTIMGKSGIRRGDTFNIEGIPEKYKKHGLFQVTQIEQTIQDMKWTTRVQGEYRQQQ